MSWDKALIGTIATVGTQDADVRLEVGGVSIGGTTSSAPNPLRSHRMWDSCTYFLATNGDMAAGSWTVTVEGTVAGVTNLPLAFRVIDPAIMVANPAGTSAIVLYSAHGSPYSICPTTVNFDTTAGSAGLSATVYAIAKTSRGQMHGGTLRHSTMVNEGVMACIPVPPAGRWAGSAAGVTAGITQDTVIRLSHTTAVGTTTWFTYNGLNQNTVWDSTLYWFDVIGVSGTWDVYVQGEIAGATVTLAGISAITGTATTAGDTTRAFISQTYGVGIKPTQVRFDVTSTGVSQSIAGTILYAAKTTKGVGGK